MKRMKEIKDKIKGIVLSFGADVCGIAHIGSFADAPEGFHPTDIYSGCKSVIVFGIALPKGIAKVNQRLIYGHFNYGSCPDADRIAFQTAKEIEKLYGGCAVPLPSDGPYEYWDDEKMEGRGLISMKHAAVLAGLGTLGKNTLLINSKYGNMLTLGAVLTELDLPSDPPALKLCIDGCDLCIKNCPAQALSETGINQKKCRTNTYGTNDRGFDVVKCSRCRTVCPVAFGK
jgi:epoxyqueuosine reductase QueG